MTKNYIFIEIFAKSENELSPLYYEYSYFAEKYLSTGNPLYERFHIARHKNFGTSAELNFFFDFWQSF